MHQPLLEVIEVDLAGEVLGKKGVRASSPPKLWRPHQRAFRIEIGFWGYDCIKGPQGNTTEGILLVIIPTPILHVTSQTEFTEVGELPR